MIPLSLKALYADHKLILEREFSIIDHQEPAKNIQKAKLTRKAKIAAQGANDGLKVWNIGSFQPADASSVQDLGLLEFPARMFVFANGGGDRYFMILSAESDADSPVYVAYYDSGGRFEVVAPSLKAFLSWERRRVDHRTKTVTDLERE